MIKERRIKEEKERRVLACENRELMALNFRLKGGEMNTDCLKGFGTERSRLFVVSWVAKGKLYSDTMGLGSAEHILNTHEQVSVYEVYGNVMPVNPQVKKSIR